MSTGHHWRITVSRFQANSYNTTTGTLYLGEIKFFTAAGTEYPTAAMTTNSAPSPYAVTYSRQQTGYEAYKAFNKANTLTNSYSSDDGSGAIWLQIDMGADYEFTKISIDPSDQVSAASGYFPIDFIVERSSTGSFAGEQTVYLASYNNVRGGLGWADNTPKEFAMQPLRADLASQYPSLTAQFGTFAKLTAQLPQLAASFGMQATLTAEMPSLLAYGGGKIAVSALAPTLYSHIIPTPQNEISAVAELPTLRAQFGMQSALTAQIPTLSASASWANVLRARLTAESPTLAAGLQVGTLVQVRARAQFPTMDARFGMQVRVNAERPTLSAHISLNGLLRANVTAQKPTLAAHITIDNVLRARLVAEYPTLLQPVVARLIAQVPTLNARIVSGADVTVVAFAINLEPGDAKAPVYEVTQYTNWPFLQIVRLGVQYFGVAADGLYLLGGDTDDEEPIAWAIETHKTDFGSVQKKMVDGLYLAGRLGHSAEISATVGEKDAITYRYRSPRGPDAQTFRQKIGKGLKGRYWAFGASDDNGGDLTLDSLEPRVLESTRRI